MGDGVGDDSTAGAFATGVALAPTEGSMLVAGAAKPGKRTTFETTAGAVAGIARFAALVEVDDGESFAGSFTASRAAACDVAGSLDCALSLASSETAAPDHGGTLALDGAAASVCGESADAAAR